jgi:hypothetical protein
MNIDIKNKVIEWIYYKIKYGIKIFDLEECIKDIGLDPNNFDDIKEVDSVFEYLEINNIPFYKMSS